MRLQLQRHQPPDLRNHRQTDRICQRQFIHWLAIERDGPFVAEGGHLDLGR